MNKKEWKRVGETERERKWNEKKKSLREAERVKVREKMKWEESVKENKRGWEREVVMNKRE